MKFKTKHIVFIGLLISINIILTRIFTFYPLPTVRISFGDIPIMLSGIFFGPLAGAVTGALADISGTLLFPPPTGATYFPGFTLSKILVGIIPVLAVRYLKGSDIFRIACGVVVTEIICSLILDTLWLSMMYSKGILILLPPRIISRSIITLIEIPILYILKVRLGRLNFIWNV